MYTSLSLHIYIYIHLKTGYHWDKGSDDRDLVRGRRGGRIRWAEGRPKFRSPRSSYVSHPSLACNNRNNRKVMCGHTAQHRVTPRHVTHLPVSTAHLGSQALDRLPHRFVLEPCVRFFGVLRRCGQ